MYGMKQARSNRDASVHGWINRGSDRASMHCLTDLVEHEELGVALVQVVLLPPHLDVHVVDRVPVEIPLRAQARGSVSDIQ